MLTSEGYFHACPSLLGQKGMAAEDISYMANSNYFPQLERENDFDSHVRYANFQFDKTRPIVFTGERFSKESVKDPVTYILVLDMLRTVGIFDVRIDSDNVMPLLAAFSAYNNRFDDVLTNWQLWPLGTVLITYGSVECLVEKSNGSKQLIDVGPNELFLVPLEADSRSRIKVKNNLIGNLEKEVHGGVLGLVIDTREKNNPKFFNEKIVSKKIKIWEERLNLALSAVL